MNPEPNPIDRRSSAPLSPYHQTLLDEYRLDAEARGLTEKTLLNYTSDIRVFLHWLKGLDPVSATDDQLRGFLGYIQKERKVGVRAVLRYYSAIESFFQFLEYLHRIVRSPVPMFRKRFLTAIRKEAKKNRVALRQLIDPATAGRFILSILDPRDRAINVLLAKTGIRREEASLIDLEDIDWQEQSILLKLRRKRTNLIVFFDDECARSLKDWLSVRALRGAPPDSGPLFTGPGGARLSGKAIYDVVRAAAERFGLHDPKGSLKKRFTAHNWRHWFTTWLRRAGMKREHIAWLRGDAPTETIDIYNHIDPKEVRQEYLRCVPQLGI